MVFGIGERGNLGREIWLSQQILTEISAGKILPRVSAQPLALIVLLVCLTVGSLYSCNRLRSEPTCPVKRAVASIFLLAVALVGIFGYVECARGGDAGRPPGAAVDLLLQRWQMVYAAVAAFALLGELWIAGVGRRVKRLGRACRPAASK